MAMVFGVVNVSLVNIERDVNQEWDEKRLNFGSCKVNWSIRHIVV